MSTTNITSQESQRQSVVNSVLIEEEMAWQYCVLASAKGLEILSICRLQISNFYFPDY